VCVCVCVCDRETLTICAIVVQLKNLGFFIISSKLSL